MAKNYESLFSKELVFGKFIEPQNTTSKDLDENAKFDIVEVGND